MDTLITKLPTMDESQKLNDLAREFFTTLGIEFTEVNTTVQDLEHHIYCVRIATTDSPLLIGPHGRTLEETQSLLMQIAENTLGTHCIIHLEINDYLAEKHKKLLATVDWKVDLTKKNGIDQVIYELSGFERKQVHAYISETYPDVTTKSLDGERGRELHIMLKEGVAPTGGPIASETKKKYTSDTSADLAALDLDGTDI